MFNLISNAFKYTPRGGTVTLGGKIHGEDVRIFVDDTGPGVSPEIMPLAFERFSAKGGAAARAGAGLGLRWCTASSNCTMAGWSWNRMPDKAPA